MLLKIKIAAFFLLLLSVGLRAQTVYNNALLFDDDWRFYRGGAQGAETPGFNDANWRTVHLPHDWSIEDIPGTSSPFIASAISQASGGFTMGGTGWYRKTFAMPNTDKGKRVVLQFDGVYMNADVWLNGKSLGKHPYGYTSFWYDITDRLKYGEENLLAVRVRNEGENSRWYSGSGIYRHVWLKTVAPVHVAQWGTYITTPEVSAAAAKVNARTKVLNESGTAAQVSLTTKLLNDKGEEVSNATTQQKIEAGATFEFDQNMAVKNPALWSVASPLLHTAVTEVYSNGELVHTEKTRFGIRSISFDAVNGFRLNGTTLKLKGGCVHHDNGPLGAKAYDRAEERRVELLKASGYNAIRCAHNPPSPAFLDACDRLGMLVIDEAFDAWKGGKNPFDYHLYFNDWWQKDIESMVYRDRNHPSIIMWSTGNEIPNREKPEVVAVAKMLSDYLHQLDPTRAVTCGVNGVEENKDPFFATLDVAGYNYALDKYEPDHKRLPNRVIFATESFPLDAFNYWMGVEDHPWVIGDFVWTSFDYIGEASIGWLGYPQMQNFFPWNLAYCGDIDVCGWKRPQSYYRDALWKGNQLSLFVKAPQPSFDTNAHKVDWSRWDWPDVVDSWNWQGFENKPMEVTAYSSCDQVELFINGKSLGKKPTNRSTKFIATWQVPYQKGIIKAVGYTGKKQVNATELHSADAPAQIKLTADKTTLKADGQDLSYVTVELLDDKGVRNPTAENLITFELQGAGTIVGVGNANPMSIESNQQPQRKAWRGKCLVIIKSDKKGGNIRLQATGEGVKPAQITLQAQ